MTQRHDPSQATDAMVQQVIQWSHEPPCKHVYAIFVAASAICVVSAVLLGITGFTVSRILTGYDAKLTSLASVDMERAAVIARIEQTLLSQQKILDEQRLELKDIGAATRDMQRLLQSYRSGTP